MQSTMNGAIVRGREVEFRVWVPAAQKVVLRLMRAGRCDAEDISMRRLGSADFGLPDLSELVDMDTWALTGIDARPGDRYFYMVNDQKPVPDPVSRLLPEGVHGPTEIVEPGTFRWTDHDWRGRELRDYVIYELHIGTFTSEGTFDTAIEKLSYLKQLGVSIIEVMPVNAFPGKRNWGYDGVGLYAVQASYGGPDAFKRFVDAAHREGLGVMLDVVYNHLGNEGNYLRMFGPYFTAKHQTPWGEAVNYDDDGCEGVRRFIVDNALYWIREYHLDGLRLDAVQTIKDDSPLHITAEIQQNVQALARELGRIVCVTVETDENDSRYVLPAEKGGYGLDAVWSDDFHHALHAYLTGEREGYYQDFGNKKQIARALNEGFVFQGEFFHYWSDVRGTSAVGIPLPKHIISIQNHDQVGNRARGERLNHLVPRGARKLAAALLLLAPQTPLLFMGQEYDEPSPFQFFTDFGDPNLQQAVSEGRRKEFKAFKWDDVPDPQDASTFERSRLHWDLATDENDMLRWYRQLLALRRRHIAHGERTCAAEFREDELVMQVPRDEPKILVVARFRGEANYDPGKCWRQAFASDEDGYAVRVFQRLRSC
ncbi:MAG TPA: malto-oligosyltrehalose trehalohydrolase [Clostridia bacterium]|nr:malto-oligosyltrehalose trehalohydrolase [Clostridia bacterium]